MDNNYKAAYIEFLASLSSDPVKFKKDMAEIVANINRRKFKLIKGGKE